ncbi:putative ubiquitinyl hydrolase 1 [Helianthus annuus]|nr:putative ubiquitinyl hydrolase 1 [Helianthus annuus]
MYACESEKAKILYKVDETDMTEHLRIRLKKEEAHLYTNIKVACDGDLHEQIGKHIYFDLVDLDKVRMQNQPSFALFQEEVAKELGVPVQYQRFWRWEKRSNHTYRPVRPLTPQEKALPR